LMCPHTQFLRSDTLRQLKGQHFLPTIELARST
jgi:hypothetical protein